MSKTSPGETKARVILELAKSYRGHEAHTGMSIGDIDRFLENEIGIGKNQGLKPARRIAGELKEIGIVDINKRNNSGSQKEEENLRHPDTWVCLNAPNLYRLGIIFSYVYDFDPIIGNKLMKTRFYTDSLIFLYQFAKTMEIDPNQAYRSNKRRYSEINGKNGRLCAVFEKPEKYYFLVTHKDSDKAEVFRQYLHGVPIAAMARKEFIWTKLFVLLSQIRLIRKPVKTGVLHFNSYVLLSRLKPFKILYRKLRTSPEFTRFFFDFYCQYVDLTFVKHSKIFEHTLFFTTGEETSELYPLASHFFEELMALNPGPNSLEYTVPIKETPMQLKEFANLHDERFLEKLMMTKIDFKKGVAEIHPLTLLGLLKRFQFPLWVNNTPDTRWLLAVLYIFLNAPSSDPIGKLGLPDSKESLITGDAKLIEELMIKELEDTEFCLKRWNTIFSEFKVAIDELGSDPERVFNLIFPGGLGKFQLDRHVKASEFHTVSLKNEITLIETKGTSLLDGIKWDSTMIA